MQIQFGNSTANGQQLSPKAATTILVAVFLLVNILLLSVLGIFAALKWKSIYLFFKGETTDGIVVDFKSSGGMDPGSAAVIEFTVNGQKYTIDTSYYNNQSKELGDHLKVIYYPSDPSIAQFDTYEERWEILGNVAGGVCPSLIMVDLTILFILVIRKVMGRKVSAPG